MTESINQAWWSAYISAIDISGDSKNSIKESGEEKLLEIIWFVGQRFGFQRVGTQGSTERIQSMMIFSFARFCGLCALPSFPFLKIVFNRVYYSFVSHQFGEEAKELVIKRILIF